MSLISMSLAVYTIERMIQETLEATRKVPIMPDKYGTELGLGFRLAVLKEVKSELMRVESLAQDRVDSSCTVQVPDNRCLCYDSINSDGNNPACPRHSP